MVALAITPLCSKDTQYKVNPYDVSFSQGQQNLETDFHNGASTAQITKWNLDFVV